MGIPPEPDNHPEPDDANRRVRVHAGPDADGSRRGRRQSSDGRRSFDGSMRGLEQLAAAGGRVSLCVVDLDQAADVARGDDFVTLPVGHLGVLPLLIEAAVVIDGGSGAASAVLPRAVPEPSTSGLWGRLTTTSLPLTDLAVLTAAVADPLATNALLDAIGAEAVRARIEQLGLTRTVLLDRVREHRGPDDAPHMALASTRDLVTLFRGLAGGRVVSAGVSSRVIGWLALNTDLGLAGAATGLDPLSHHEAHGDLLLVNKTGREPGVRAEAGVLAGPRGSVAYAMVVQFDEAAVSDRLRVHDAFRTMGNELMEYLY